MTAAAREPAHPKSLLVPMLVAAAMLVSAATAGAQAQEPPVAAAPALPDDSPSFKFGLTLFADYSYQQEPTVTDTDGNEINPHSFNVTRTYLNFTGQVSHLVAFRVTPDITALAAPSRAASCTGSSTRTPS